MQLAVQCKLCPVCDGVGTKDPTNRLPKKRKEFTCENCQGQKYVPLVTCRGCGRAAIEWDAPVPFCGRKDCWEKLVEVVDANKPRNNVSPFPFHAAGLVVTDRRRSFDGRQVWDPFRQDYVDSVDLQDRGRTFSPEEEAQIAQAMTFGWCGDC